jgi:hypothetical protein
LSPSRLAAIAMIYGVVSLAWSTLGASLLSRTGERDQQLSKEVSQLWGGQHVQLAPDAWYETERQVLEMVEEKDQNGQVVRKPVVRTVADRHGLALTQSRVDVAFDLDPRKKGLLWYDTYAVAFKAEHRFRNDTGAPRVVNVHFAFPSAEALYDGFRLTLDGRDAPRLTDLSSGVTASTRVEPGAEAVLQVAYRSRGLEAWTYSFGRDGIAQVADFQLAATTDFEGYDFPAGALSPSRVETRPGGARLVWSFESLVTGQRIAIDPPNRLNPGPLAARITFFAPVSLLFFFAVMVVTGVLRGRSLHPMNYLFLAAAFFAFHLLLAYLVDHLDLHASFAIAACASVFLVTSYLRIVSGLRAGVLEAGVAQLVYLVLFSYAFFFEGYAGLSVTLGAVATLFVLMQLTARVDWSQALGGPERAASQRTTP